MEPRRCRELTMRLLRANNTAREDVEMMVITPQTRHELVMKFSEAK